MGREKLTGIELRRFRPPFRQGLQGRGCNAVCIESERCVGRPGSNPAMPDRRNPCVTRSVGVPGLYCYPANSTRRPCLSRGLPCAAHVGRPGSRAGYPGAAFVLRGKEAVMWWIWVLLWLAGLAICVAWNWAAGGDPRSPKEE